ncbi:MAG: SelB C-terminal domain-containing protein, partial [Gemmatimonadota bacterium]|nr:SelB C-terminal domain-containing protein [Gemmatimonadota bacterium]
LHAADRRAAGVSIEAVRSALSSTRSAELVQACLEHHLTEGSLTASGPLVSFPGAGATLTPAEQAHFEALVNALAAGGLQPPTVNDLTGSLRVSRDVLDDLLRLLVGNGDACAVTPEIYVNAAAMEALGERVREMLSGGKIGTPKAFKDEFSLSRKYLIPLLEYLDRTGVTRRVSEGRILVG